MIKTMIAGRFMPQKEPETETVNAIGLYKPLVRQPISCLAITCESGRHIIAAFDFADENCPLPRFATLVVPGSRGPMRIGHCDKCGKGPYVSIVKTFQALRLDRFDDILDWDAHIDRKHLPSGMSVCDSSDKIGCIGTQSKSQTQALYDMCTYLDSHVVDIPPFSNRASERMRKDKMLHHERYPKITEHEFKRFEGNKVGPILFGGMPYYCISMHVIEELMRLNPTYGKRH